MSLWKTFLLFIDVWGIGNRGMFRTLRDLIFRPGYLISDYIRGKRSAYFPPFKLLFLLTTLSLLVDHGWNLQNINYENVYITDKNDLSEQYNDDDDIDLNLYKNFHLLGQFQQDYPAFARLCYTLFFSVIFFVFFRKTKKIGTLSFQEFLIGMVYMVNMANIYTIIIRFFGGAGFLVSLPTIMYVLPLKQLSGYSWGKTIWRAVVSLLLSAICITIILSIV